MKVIGTLLDLAKMLDTNGWRSGRISLGTARIKSISSFSSKSIYYFPTVMTDGASLEESKMIAKALEKTYSVFVANCISLIPFHRIKADDYGKIDNYLKIFHQNIGIDEPMDIGMKLESHSGLGGISEAVATEFCERKWVEFLKEASTQRYFDDIEEVPAIRAIHEMYLAPLPGHMKFHLIKNGNKELVQMVEQGIQTEAVTLSGNLSYDVDEDRNFKGSEVTDVKKLPVTDRNVFVDQKMEKANEMLPTMIKANIGFIVEETNEVIQREILIGVKTYIRRMKSSVLVNELYDTIINKRKFLRFIKIMTGEEEETLLDLILGLKEIKSTAKKKMEGNADILISNDNRKRMSKLTAGLLRNNYNPNLSLVMTMNEANMLKEKGIDLFSSSHVELLMKELFFLGFVILDQANEVAYIQFDSHNYKFQEYPYSTLEREISTNDRMMRELYRTIQR